MPRQRRERINGPYRHGRRWRFIHVAIDGGQTPSKAYASKEAAAKAANKARDELDRERVTVGAMIDEYIAYKRRQGLKESSWRTNEFRLRAMFDADESLSRITAKRAQAIYDDYADSGVAVDTHRSALRVANNFAKWCIKRGHWRRNPFEEVEGVGRKRTGKPQLTRDEAERFYAAAIGGGDGGVACLLALLIGLRAGEIAGLECRDASGGVLTIREAKTDAGRRRISMPDVLAVKVGDVSKRQGGGRLFGGRDRHWVARECSRLCRLAGVAPVTPHGLRGTHASLCAEVGMTGHAVASALGHTSYATTAAHYARADAIAQGRVDTVSRLLEVRR